MFHFSLSSDLPRCLISATMMLRYLYDMALDNFDKYVHEIVIKLQRKEYHIICFEENGCTANRC